MTDEPTVPARRQLPGWLFVIVPMVLAAVLVGSVAIAVRTGQDDSGAPDVSGPAAELPAVTDAIEQLGVAGASDTPAAALGGRYGEITVGFGTLTDEVEFAERFDRLPDAEAELLGRTLGTIQAQLSPSAIGGPRGEDDRAGDIGFALALAHGAVQTIEPGASPRDQALAVLPFAVQDLVGFDELADTFAAGDFATVATRIDSGESGESGTRGALTDAGAAELVSSVAFLIGERFADPELRQTFTDAYQAALPL